MFRPLAPQLSERQWETWRRAARDVVQRLPGDEVAVFVADHPDRPGTLVSCGAGVVVPRLPNPWHPHGRAGYVQWMSTEPEFRRRGYGRAVLQAVLAWFDQGGVDNVELHATEQGEPLYRSEGFWRGSGGEPMRRRPWDPPPEGA
ncbi:MAG TPA: GNAT family N-acetyltransferase [Acidimicrobiales bacterium]|nr:GNAT family N-acetyltransferase [Acidimicrobiales bacterium]